MAHRLVGLFAMLFIPLAVTFTAKAEDRYTPIIEQAGDLVANAGGYVVNQKRAAVQHELARQAPTPAELGVRLPPKSTLKLEQTARQIAQYHPTWRVYAYGVAMPRADFVQFFVAQGLVFDVHRNVLLFPGAQAGDPEFIDGLTSDPMTEFRVWRRP